MCDRKSYEAKPDSKETPKPTMMDELTAVKKKYEDLAKEAKIKETQGVKRKPLSDGTLPLAESELIEFFSLTGRTNDGKYPIYFFKNVYIEDCDRIYADMSRRGENYEKDSGHILITNVKAILWLAERFELTSNN